MQRPIETILMIPRVRLAKKVPIVETEKLIKLYLDKIGYYPKLINHAFEVLKKSYVYFCKDDNDLVYLIEAINSGNYTVSYKSKIVLSNMLQEIIFDNSLFKEFNNTLKPLFKISRMLRELSLLTSLKLNSIENHISKIDKLLGLSLIIP